MCVRMLLLCRALQMDWRCLKSSSTWQFSLVMYELAGCLMAARGAAVAAVCAPAAASADGAPQRL
jgi:hypothetical protein